MKPIVIIAVFFSAFGSSVYANQFLDNITESCINDGSIQLVGFSDIVPNENQKSGESKYKIGNNYEGGVFNLSRHRDSDSNYSTIWFYSTVKNNQLPSGSGLFWHLIITPSEIQRKHTVRGYMKDVYMEMSLKNRLITRDDFNYLIDGESKEEEFFLNNPNTDPIVQGEINKVWEKLITNRNMKAVYAEINSSNPPYMDFSLVLHHVVIDPQSINIERGGYLVPTSKKLLKKGLAHGLVLDLEGNCLAHKTIKIE